MKYRKLRIAWSVVWGVIAVLLCVLWVRSYSYVASPTRLGKHELYLARGELLIDRSWVRTSQHLVDSVNFELGDGTGRWGVQGPATARLSGKAVPVWAVTGLLIVIATIPWLRWSKRFSLRTLLIATTIIAMLLGLIVWSLK